jgi:hypothetical protein
MLTVTVDSLFLFFILLTFLLDLVSFKFPFISLISVAVTLVCIIPTLGTEWVANEMIGWLGIIMTIATFGITIMNIANVAGGKGD